MPRPLVLAPPEKIRRLAELRARLREQEAEQRRAAGGKPWRELARPEQLAPDGTWLTWIYMAGRGAGKSRAAAEWVHERAMAEPGCSIALVGRTPADVRDVMIEGDRGILRSPGMTGRFTSREAAYFLAERVIRAHLFG